ncbi:MAG: cytochrome c peroxidase [Bacteroidota bacterium]
MRLLRTLLFLISTLFFWTACEVDSNTMLEEQQTELDVALENTLATAAMSFGDTDKTRFQMPSSDAYASIPQDPNNAITAEKVALGQLLYHEASLGVKPKLGEGMQTYSCASCHFAAAGFQAGTAQGIGDGGIGIGARGDARGKAPNYAPSEIDVQPIRTPSAMNAAYQELMLWNGQFGAVGANVGTEEYWGEGTPIEVNELGYQGLETQAIAGMGVHRMDCTEEMMRVMGYDALFDAAFPDVPVAERYNLEHAGLAMAAFERTLLANQAPFQKWLAGNSNAMNNREKRGAVLFFGKANCVSCHNNPALSTMEFHALGMGNLDDAKATVFNVSGTESAHLGRGGFTRNPMDNYKFKVPQLYNLKDSPFYGHGATFRDLESVVRYKNEAQPENADVPTTQLATQFRPLNLSDQEIQDLVAFLEDALYDPNLQRYQPSSVYSGACIPNNDLISKEHLGCN